MAFPGRKSGSTLRSAVTCEAEQGVCAVCYGQNLSRGARAEIGDAVRVIAALAIRSPDPLPEGRLHKGNCVLPGKSLRSKSCDTATRSELLCLKDTLVVEREGEKDPHELLRILGVQATARYLIEEAQQLLVSLGFSLADQHLEVIVRRMLRWIEIKEGGAARLIEGQRISQERFRALIQEANARQALPPVGARVLCGGTEAAQQQESFIDAFYERQPRALVDAALAGARADLRLGSGAVALGLRWARARKRKHQTSEAKSSGVLTGVN